MCFCPQTLLMIQTLPLLLAQPLDFIIIQYIVGNQHYYRYPYRLKSSLHKLAYTSKSNSWIYTLTILTVSSCLSTGLLLVLPFPPVVHNTTTNNQRNTLRLIIINSPHSILSFNSVNTTTLSKSTSYYQKTRRCFEE